MLRRAGDSDHYEAGLGVTRNAANAMGMRNCWTLRGNQCRLGSPLLTPAVLCDCAFTSAITDVDYCERELEEPALSVLTKIPGLRSAWAKATRHFHSDTLSDPISTPYPRTTGERSRGPGGQTCESCASQVGRWLLCTAHSSLPNVDKCVSAGNGVQSILTIVTSPRDAYSQNQFDPTHGACVPLSKGKSAGGA